MMSFSHVNEGMATYRVGKNFNEKLVWLLHLLL